MTEEKAELLRKRRFVVANRDGTIEGKKKTLKFPPSKSAGLSHKNPFENKIYGYRDLREIVNSGKVEVLEEERHGVAEAY